MRKYKLNESTLKLLISFILVSNPTNALAYLEPGLWSYAFHIVIASALGLAYGARAYWYEIKEKLENCSPRKRVKSGAMTTSPTI